MFGNDGEDSEQNGKETDEADDEEPGDEIEGNEKNFNSKWGWIYTIKVIADTTNTSWDKVTEMPTIEALNLFCFAKDLAEFQQSKLDKIKHRKRM